MWAKALSSFLSLFFLPHAQLAAFSHIPEGGLATSNYSEASVRSFPFSGAGLQLCRHCRVVLFVSQKQMLQMGFGRAASNCLSVYCRRLAQSPSVNCRLVFSDINILLLVKCFVICEMLMVADTVCCSREKQRFQTFFHCNFHFSLKCYFPTRKKSQGKAPPGVLGGGAALLFYRWLVPEGQCCRDVSRVSPFLSFGAASV